MTDRVLVAESQRQRSSRAGGSSMWSSCMARSALPARNRSQRASGPGTQSSTTRRTPPGATPTASSTARSPGEISAMR